MSEAFRRLILFLRELRRRHVYRVAVAYLVAAFVVVQLADLAGEPFGMPAWFEPLVWVLCGLGFPIALVLSWAYDVTPEGVRQTTSGSASGVEATAAEPGAAPGGPGRSDPSAVAGPPLPPASGDTPDPKSIAVLPFEDMTRDEETGWFADGMTEDVITQLSKIADLKVLSRFSSTRLQDRSLAEIAQRLGVATVLEGSVRQAGDRVRIVAQLIDVGSDRHLWAETYDRQISDVFQIQTEVSLAIAGALKAELSPDERSRMAEQPTESIRAYRIYLDGLRSLQDFTDPGIRSGLERLEEAVEIDPGFAAAHTWIALAHLILGLGYGSGAIPSDRAHERAREAVESALTANPDHGDALSVRGFLRCVADFDWRGAERDFGRALELSPGSPLVHDQYGHMLSALGRFEEAIAAHRRAQELNPLAPNVSADLASSLLRAGRYDEAASEADWVIELEPGFPRGHAALGWAHLLRGDEEMGLSALEQAVSLAPGDTAWRAQLGNAYARAGRTEEARDVLASLEEQARERYVSPYHLAYVHAGLGNRGKAIGALHRAVEARAGGVYGIGGSFLFAPLRDDPRFRALLEKMGLD